MKTHSINTLKNWSKQDLIEYIVMLEKNYEGLESRFDIQYHNCLKLIDDMAIVNEEYKQARKHWWNFIDSQESKQS